MIVVIFIYVVLTDRCQIDVLFCIFAMMYVFFHTECEFIICMRVKVII